MINSVHYLDYNHVFAQTSTNFPCVCLDYQRTACLNENSLQFGNKGADLADKL